jgi:Calcineurin-like phosphoesterase
MQKMFRVLAHIFLLPAFLVCSGQGTSLADGPYVFYNNNYLLIASISNGVLKKDSFDVRTDKAPLLSVAVPGRPGTFFSVPLKGDLTPEASTYRAATKLLALSDIEGTFEGLNKLLVAGGVIDKDFNWTFGSGHLVICGDLFDRGEEVTACLWLLYKLEDEAKANGGYVHVILGNHDIMNLSEDFRYVAPKYMHAAALMGKEYKDLYTVNTELGRWLRTKNIMERIGDCLFLHGGISQTINETGLSLKAINNRVRPYYQMSGYDSLLNRARVLPFFEDTSPFWYRGYFLAPRASMAQVDSTLNLFNVKRIVVGHDVVDRIQTLYEGKVIAIDVDYHAGNYQALAIEKDALYRMDAGGEKKRLN